MAQFFHSKTVVNSILFVYEERRHQRSYSSTQIHESMSRYHNKGIKMLVAFLPTLKMFLSVEIDSEFIEAVARSCSLKNGIVKSFEKIARNYFCWSLCFEKLD